MGFRSLVIWSRVSSVSGRRSTPPTLRRFSIDAWPRSTCASRRRDLSRHRLCQSGSTLSPRSNRGTASCICAMRCAKNYGRGAGRLYVSNRRGMLGYRNSRTDAQESFTSSCRYGLLYKRHEGNRGHGKRTQATLPHLPSEYARGG